jgi:hypothetical protein
VLWTLVVEMTRMNNDNVVNTMIMTMMQQEGLVVVKFLPSPFVQQCCEQPGVVVKWGMIDETIFDDVWQLNVVLQHPETSTNCYCLWYLGCCSLEA